jgi:SAM-dependent methyltransferase
MLHGRPNISNNIKSTQNYKELAKLLLGRSKNPHVLVLGGGRLGVGMEALLAADAIEIVESDISFGPRTQLIADAHDIPFTDDSFDGVVVQAVLEHVLDPYRCVEEIFRVLKKGSFVYAETAFMQQVHGGRCDFTRFTYLGHRRLFRRFEEIRSGVIGGPGMALAWSYQYFLLSFTESKLLRKLIQIFVRLTSFYFKYLDYYLLNKTGAYDAASSLFFLGQKTTCVLPDRELIRVYKGGFA